MDGQENVKALEVEFKGDPDCSPSAESESAEGKEQPVKEKPKKEAPAQVVRDGDDLVRDVRDLEEMTTTRGWKTFYGNMLAAKASAKEGFLTAAKMNEVIHGQATVSLVDNQIERLKDTITRLNELYERYPLFRDEFRYKGEFDETTGRVTLIEKTETSPPVENEETTLDDDTDGSTPSEDASEQSADVEGGNHEVDVTQPEQTAEEAKPEVADPFGE